MTVARLGDTTPAFACAGGMLARDKAEVGHQLAGRFEAAPVDNFRRQHHRAVPFDPAETLQPSRWLPEGGGERQRFDLCIKLDAARQLVLEQRKVLAKDDGIFRREDSVASRKSMEPGHMPTTPMRPGPIDKATTGEELENVVTGLEQLALNRFAAPDEIAHALFGLTRNADRREFTGAQEPREFDGIALVMFACLRCTPGRLGISEGAMTSQA